MIRPSVRNTPRTPRAARAGLPLLLLLAASACGEDVRLIYVDAGYVPPPPDAGAAPEADAGDADAGTEDGGPGSVGPLEIDTEASAQEIDLFGVPGHRLWLDVDADQLAIMNERANGALGNGHYTPDAPGSRTDHLAVEDAKTGSVADYGKVGVRLVGESTGANWTRSAIPNFRFDTDEFENGQTIGGFEHFRLNNGQVGTIFREALAHRIYREMGYPALRTNWAFVGGSVWGKKTWVPMTMVEVYKQRFCEDNQDLLGGSCTNMWEFAGDPGGGAGGGRPGGGGGFPLPIPIDVGGPMDIGRPGGGDGGSSALGWLPANACQVKTCDTTRLGEFEQALVDAPTGEGFKAALEPFVDWSMFHQFQCLSWILWVGDDTLHNTNNNLLIERDDGRLVFAPYSVDISMGGVSFAGDDAHAEAYLDVPLLGSNTLALRCQADPTCWADTIATCEEAIAKFDALDPEGLLDEAVQTLSALEMMREGDDKRAKRLRDWLEERQLGLTDELALYRHLPSAEGTCEAPGDVPCQASFCGGTGCICTTEEVCAGVRCEQGTSFCDALNRCVAPEEQCPTCTEQLPLYCLPADACVADLDACSAVCAAQSPGTAYCPEFQYCSESCDIIVEPVRI